MKQSRLHRVGGTVHDACDLLAGEAQLVAQHHREPLLLRQLHQRMAQPVTQLLGLLRPLRGKQGRGRLEAPLGDQAFRGTQGAGKCRCRR